MVHAVRNRTRFGAHDFSGRGSEALRSSSTYQGLWGGNKAGKEKEGAFYDRLTSLIQISLGIARDGRHAVDEIYISPLCRFQIRGGFYPAVEIFRFSSLIRREF